MIGPPEFCIGDPGDCFITTHLHIGRVILLCYKTSIVCLFESLEKVGFF